MATIISKAINSSSEGKNFLESCYAWSNITDLSTTMYRFFIDENIYLKFGVDSGYYRIYVGNSNYEISFFAKSSTLAMRCISCKNSVILQFSTGSTFQTYFPTVIIGDSTNIRTGETAKSFFVIDSSSTASTLDYYLLSGDNTTENLTKNSFSPKLNAKITTAFDIVHTQSESKFDNALLIYQNELSALSNGYVNFGGKKYYMFGNVLLEDD